MPIFHHLKLKVTSLYNAYYKFFLQNKDEKILNSKIEILNKEIM